MVSDQEPRYRLVDDEGNIVGSLYGKADGSVAIQETDSGSDREVALAPDGTFSAPSVETQLVSTEDLDIGDDWLVAVDSDDLESKLSDGKNIRLFNRTYSIDTLDKAVVIEGVGPPVNSTTRETVIQSDGSDSITIDGGVGLSIHNVLFDDELEINDDRVQIMRSTIRPDGITVNADNVDVSHCVFSGQELKFESGTEGGVAIGNRQATITDNGDNEVIGNT